MTVDPVVKTIRVSLAPKAAFDLFTRRTETWWPMDSHSVSAGIGTPAHSLAMTCELGGALIETTADGTTHTWGTVLELADGESFAMTWHPGRTDGAETHLHVAFQADGSGTLVTLTHSNWDNLGKEAQKTRDGYNGGWDGVLAAYLDVESARQKAS